MIEGYASTAEFVNDVNYCYWYTNRVMALTFNSDLNEEESARATKRYFLSNSFKPDVNYFYNYINGTYAERWNGGSSATTSALIRDYADGRSLFADPVVREYTLLSLEDGHPNSITLYQNGEIETTENLEEVEVLLSGSEDLEPTKLTLSVRPYGTNIKPYYKFNWRVESITSK